MMTPKYTRHSLNKFGWALLWSALTAYYAQNIYAHEFVWLFVLVCFLLSARNLKRLYKLIVQGVYQAKLNRNIRTVSDNHGSAKFETEEGIREKGYDNGNRGVPVGVLGSTVIFYDFVHGLCSAPARSGKTISGPLTAITHGYRIELTNGSSFAAPTVNVDVKRAELTNMTKNLIEEHLGHSVVCLNPSLQNGLPNTGYNPLYLIVDGLKDDDRHRYALSDTSEIVFLLLPEPEGGEDKNKYWRNGSRNIIIAVIIYLAATKPQHCHLGEVFSIVSNHKRLIQLLTEASRSWILKGDLKTIALGILSTPEEKLAEFVSGAIQVLQPFSKSSDLGQSVSCDEFRFESLCDKEQLTSVFIIAPYERRQAYAIWTGLVIQTATKALLRTDSDIPVVFNIDEATNFNLHGLAQDLTALGYRIRIRLWYQAKSELLRVVGKESAETFYSQTNFKQFFKVSSYAEAKEIADYIGEYTVKVLNIGPDGTSVDSDNKPSWSETGKPLFSAQDILNMANDEQIVIINGLKPIKCKRLPYNHVPSWHGMLDDNPLEGGKLPLDPRVDITYREVTP